MTSKNNKYLLIPSKTNSISLTLNNNNEKERNYRNNIIPKKMNIKKMSNEQMKKLKIFKRFKIGKKLRKISLSKNKILNLTNSNLKEESKISENINDKSINSSLKKNKERDTIIQSVTDEKMMEIASYYLNNDETVDKILIDDILLSKKK